MQRLKLNFAVEIMNFIRKIKYLFVKNPSDTEVYGVPGQGKALLVSIFSVIFFAAIWIVVTLPIFPSDVEGELIPYIKPLFLPSPNDVFDKFVFIWSEEFSGGTLPTHIGWSMYRVFGAFFLATATAVPLGILMGINKHVRGFLDPPIEFYRPIPPLAYLPLMVIWFGIGELSKILLIFLAIFAPLVLNTRAGVRSVGIELIHAAYSMGATRAQVTFQIILKGAMPEILTGMRIGIGFGWTTLVAAELVAAQAGLGAMIKSASDFLVTDVVVMGIVVIGLVAYSFDLLMRYFERVAVPWKGK